MSSNKSPRIFYGYVVVGAASLIIMVLYGCRNSFGIFFKPVLSEFGWPRGTTSAAFSLSFLSIGLFGVIMGRLTDRFGPRLAASIGGLCLGGGFLLMPLVREVWQFYLIYGVMVALGISSAVPLISLPAHWFVRRRGLLSGVVVVGAGLGTVIIPPLANYLISTYDWRVSYSAIGILSLIVILPAAQFLRHDPGQIGLAPYGAGEARMKGSGRGSQGLSLSQALHTREFWTLSAGFFCFNFCLQTVLVHIAVYAIGLGVSSAGAAGIVAIIGATSIAGRLVMGSVSDRIGGRYSFMVCFALLLTALLWLLFARSVLSLSLFALVFGFAYGGQAASQSPLVAEFFGLSSHTSIFGVSYFIFACGAIGPGIAGSIFDQRGSYFLAFLVCIALAFVGLVLIYVSTIGQYSENGRLKNEITE